MGSTSVHVCVCVRTHMCIHAHVHMCVWEGGRGETWEWIT